MLTGSMNIERCQHAVVFAQSIFIEPVNIKFTKLGQAFQLVTFFVIVRKEGFDQILCTRRQWNSFAICHSRIGGHLGNLIFVDHQQSRERSNAFVSKSLNNDIGSKRCFFLRCSKEPDTHCTERHHVIVCVLDRRIRHLGNDGTAVALGA